MNAGVASTATLLEQRAAWTSLSDLLCMTKTKPIPNLSKPSQAKHKLEKEGSVTGFSPSRGGRGDASGRVALPTRPGAALRFERRFDLFLPRKQDWGRRLIGQMRIQPGEEFREIVSDEVHDVGRVGDRPVVRLAVIQASGLGCHQGRRHAFGLWHG